MGFKEVRIVRQSTKNLANLHIRHQYPLLCAPGPMGISEDIKVTDTNKFELQKVGQEVRHGLIGRVNNSPTIPFLTGTPRVSQSKSY